ncbi:1-aminocyclopropane-1-carboxylate oxidase homolog 4-like [Dendrobium catenatum]|uniref:1-aminocyclopropane-1-carboxylate oxidase like 12 n=1 Tax=Dendrobium catenatum TaxID=906689 RepID=A0A2I0X5B3_9ASPA|nr:1-aminocyclopropane-1-carboxylate oxidase homolog 4-like [Dendrobium catenatum]PKU83092.1 1-aminocyclopropane-1-carboxylate oxidase like 12 [Dendrobium catenatum]
MATAGTENGDGHVAARRAFDETKAGVKGLVDGGATTIPSFFYHPKPRFIPPPPPPHLSVPIIDFSLPRTSILPAVVSAACNWGFFQVINHSIPLPILSRALSSARSFHELPAAERSRYYSREYGGGVSYISNVDLYSSSAASWRDTLQIRMGPTPPDQEKIPAVCRQELNAWDTSARGLARQVMGMLAEGMGVEEDRLEKITCLNSRVLACHYYPPCPEPEATAGLVDHSDPGVLALLLQDDIGGLQIKKEGEDGECWWVDVKPVEGTVVVNVGDLLQVISNDKYKSVHHRVLANSHKKARASIAMFLNPDGRSESDLYGPLPELLSNENPARYRNFTMSEFMRTFFSKQLASKCLLDHFRIQSDDTKEV